MTGRGGSPSRLRPASLHDQRLAPRGAPAVARMTMTERALVDVKGTQRCWPHACIARAGSRNSVWTRPTDPRLDIRRLKRRKPVPGDGGSTCASPDPAGRRTGFGASLGPRASSARTVSDKQHWVADRGGSERRMGPDGCVRSGAKLHGSRQPYRATKRRRTSGGTLTRSLRQASDSASACSGGK